MDKEQKQKMEKMKQQAREKIRKQSLQNNVLLQECLAELGSYRLIEEKEEIERLVDLASSPGAEMHSHDDPVVLEDTEQYFIIWDEASLPVVMCSGKQIRENWDDVVAVAFDSYFVAELSGKVIGIRH